MTVLRTDWSTLEVGERRWPIASFDNETTDSFYTRRVRLQFENGWLLSVVWGSCTYSSNHGFDSQWDKPFTEEPTTVELAAWNDRLGGGLCEWPGGDTVEGYVSVDDLPAIIDTIDRLPSGATEMLVFPPAGREGDVT